jgi:hypothetical protein
MKKHIIIAWVVIGSLVAPGLILAPRGSEDRGLTVTLACDESEISILLSSLAHIVRAGKLELSSRYGRPPSKKEKAVCTRFQIQRLKNRASNGFIFKIGLFANGGSYGTSYNCC